MLGTNLFSYLAKSGLYFMYGHFTGAAISKDRETNHTGKQCNDNNRTGFNSCFHGQRF